MSRSKLIKAFSVVLFLFVVYSAKAQQTFIPLQQEYSRLIEREAIKQNLAIHSSLKPYLQSEVAEQFSYDSLLAGRYSNTSRKEHSWILRKLYQEHLLQYKDSTTGLYADLLMDFTFGKELGQGYLFTNTRGAQVQGNLGKHFSFYTAFYENQSKLPDYLDKNVKERGVVPGQGKARSNGEGFDYAIPYGYISYTPNKTFNIQFGQDKNFLGDGYRSLILSDYAYSYPFLKINTRFWKIKYTNLWTQYMDISKGFQGSSYPKKYAAYQYLSFLPTPELNVSIFQSLIWAADSTGNGAFEPAFLNPIIFMNSLNFNMGSPANSMMGLNIRYNLFRQFSFYGQFVLDDFNVGKLKQGNGFFQQKFGYQMGLKAFDIFGLSNLYAQVEYNTVRPYVYAHKIPSLNNTHYNEPLAHPLGANFKELIAIGSYRYRRFSLDAKLNYAAYGADATINEHNGKNIFLSDYDAPNGELSFGNYTGQGTKTKLYHFSSSLNYLMNPHTGLKVEAGFAYRKEASAIVNTNTQLFYFGVKTNLRNRYYDF
ncbi:hypothetical protein ACFSRY_10760 [Pontibacter locisalis]|uniref:Gliding motility protein RemB n=1 Tax=Pontibacter locisalis TaxID=1719035 RepID=A0ABW5ILM1_9BACT